MELTLEPWEPSPLVAIFTGSILSKQETLLFVDKRNVWRPKFKTLHAHYNFLFFIWFYGYLFYDNISHLRTHWYHFIAEVWNIVESVILYFINLKVQYYFVFCIIFQSLCQVLLSSLVYLHLIPSKQRPIHDQQYIMWSH